MNPMAENSATQDPPVFYIQIAEDVQGAVTPEASTDKFILATQEKLEKVAICVRDTAGWLLGAISKLPLPPREFELEFGVSVGGEAGVPFVTKGTVDTNFKVKITWKGSGA
jgi:hypothetical protein